MASRCEKPAPRRVVASFARSAAPTGASTERALRTVRPSARIPSGAPPPPVCAAAARGATARACPRGTARRRSKARVRSVSR